MSDEPDKLGVTDQLRTWRAPRWRCEMHGDTQDVFTVFLPDTSPTYCARCVLSMFERLGLKPVPRVE